MKLLVISIRLTELTIYDFVTEYSQHFEPNECKNIYLEVIKLRKEKNNWPLWTQLSLLSLHWIMEFESAYQPILLEQEALLFLSVPFQKPFHQDRYQKYYGRRK